VRFQPWLDAKVAMAGRANKAVPGKFAVDSPLEQAGFEPSVPRKVPGISTVSALVRDAFPLAGNQAAPI